MLPPIKRPQRKIPGEKLALSQKSKSDLHTITPDVDSHVYALLITHDIMHIINSRHS